MTKVILISQFPLPYSAIGSWTTLYANYITKSQHQIDHIICPEPDSKFDDVSYDFVKDTLSTKIKMKYSGKTYDAFLNPLKQIIQPDEKYIIQIIDNQGIVAPLDDFLRQNDIRNQRYIQYFHHGFAPFNTNGRAAPVFDAIDELVLLTLDSYKYYMQYFTVLPVKVSIIHNGIDTTLFHKVDNATKDKLKQNLGVAGKTVFIWCAKDRPKKGLKIILEAWKKLYQIRQDIALLVIGAEEKNVPGATFIGLVPNNQLPQYYQASDVYLFPTLCHEGFGMTLIEAMHCGNYCIASSLGGVPEVMQYGKLGHLIETPHFVDSWFEAMQNYLQNPVQIEIPSELYSTKEWNDTMNTLINNAKFAIE